MQVSIIINNHNYGRFLRAAIDSALAQTHPQCEVIVVDDGSTDHSREMIAGYAGRVTALLQENGGQAAALNTGFAHSHGEIVIFLDADDVLLPHAVQQVVAAFANTPGAARVHQRMQVIDAGGTRTGVLKPHAHLPLAQGDLRGHVLAFPDDMPWLPTSGNAYAARVLRQVFPIPAQEFRILADVYLSHVTPLFGPVLALENAGAQYRVHGGNNYEVQSINVAQLRSTFLHWRAAHAHIRKHALALKLIRDAREAPTLSIACLANQLISLRLEPAAHPIQQDSRIRLLAQALHALRLRFNVSLLMKLMYLGWFATMAMAPRAQALALARAWHFPQTRPGLNTLLGRLQWIRPQHG